MPRSLAVLLASLCCSCGDVDRVAVEQPLLGATPDDAHPGVVAIVAGGEHLCSGVVVGASEVLTAAHCVRADGEDLSPTQLRILVGDSIDEATTIDVLDVRIVDEARDVALVSTATTPSAPAAELSTIPMAVEEPYTAVGYGRDTEGRSGTRRRLDEQRVICVGATCSSADVDVDQGQFIGSGGVCRGDSGGPAIIEGGLVAGIVVQADDACTAALYTDVAAIDLEPDDSTPTTTDPPSDPADPQRACHGERATFLWMLPLVSVGRSRTSRRRRRRRPA